MCARPRPPVLLPEASAALTCRLLLPPPCRGFSPLTGFMSQEQYDSVVRDMKLPDGHLFGLPVVMDTDDEAVVPGDKLLLTYKGKVCHRDAVSRSGCRPMVMRLQDLCNRLARVCASVCARVRACVRVCASLCVCACTHTRACVTTRTRKQTAPRTR